jgi:hypothetical protein
VRMPDQGRAGRIMRDLKSRIANLEDARAANDPVLIYQGDTPAERELAAALEAGVKGTYIFVSPLDYAL